MFLGTLTLTKKKKKIQNNQTPTTVIFKLDILPLTPPKMLAQGHIFH